MSLSNYPPGVTESMIPGYHDRDVEYTINIANFTGESDYYDHKVIAEEIKQWLNFKYIDIDSIEIIKVKPVVHKGSEHHHAYLTYAYTCNLTIGGTISIDMSNVYEDDDSAIYESIIEECSNECHEINWCLYRDCITYEVR